MSQVKSAKDILLSHDYLEAREKAQRYVRHEFQDYAYRLASDLGDLPHRHIYMRLAKTVDRTMLEQAAAFALGYFDEPNKGKLFMWKLSQLRDDLATRHKLKNFEHDFVIQETGKFMDQVFSAIEQKYLAEQKLKTDFISTLPKDKEIRRAFWWGTGLGWEAKLFSDKGVKFRGVDISRKLVQAAKTLHGEAAKIVWQPKWLKLKESGPKVDLIWAARWHAIPLESEEAYLQKFKRISNPSALIVFEANVGDAVSQRWVEIPTTGENKLYSFEKLNKLDTLCQLCIDNGLKVLEILDLNPQKSLILCELT